MPYNIVKYHNVKQAERLNLSSKEKLNTLEHSRSTGVVLEC